MAPLCGESSEGTGGAGNGGILVNKLSAGLEFPGTLDPSGPAFGGEGK